MPDRAESVQKIVEELQAGISVEENFRQLCEIWHRPLYHFFSKRGFPPQDCLDLTQETFLGIYRGIGSFRRDARFETWLFTVATNAFRKRLRTGAAEKRSGEEVSLAGGEDDRGLEDRAVADGPMPGEGMLQQERTRLLRDAIERLPEQMRKCLVLRVYHEMKYREIATVLKLSPETVKVHLFQARRRLQADLGDYFRDALADPEEGAT
ncbi:MAG TPA: sigma-70 family RNA polymerase sigma factor [Thermoanaerobaculia bacterium]|jgi:RNA polymerase sigma-70 factor (ECF subfamily)|nr:sigma-70 family RNA polymerase sigma factor [Thermoanaerobaculia bacterium]